MLAIDYNRSKHKKFKKFIAQPKYDGVRAIYADKNFQSRSGLTFEGVPEVLSSLSNLNTRGFPLDGELYSDTLDFDTISGIARRHSNNLSHLRDQVFFQVFDIVNPRIKFKDRLDFLLSVITNTDHYRRPLGIPIINDHEEIKRLLNQLLDEGYEGIILRDPESFYEFKRTASLLRWKPFDKDIFTVVDIQEEITIGGRPKRRCGALVCANKETIKFSAGGLDDDLKNKIWLNVNYYIGRSVVIKFQKRTKNGSLRSPNFVKFVEDEDRERELINSKGLIE